MTGPTPVYQVAGGDARRPRLLLLSYHFPPSQETGALRWQRMARFVAERGWELDVVTLHPDNLRSRDETRLTDLAPGTRVYGVPQSPLRRDRLEHLAWRLYRALRPRENSGAMAENGAAGEPVAGEARPMSLARRDMHWPRSARDLLRRWSALSELTREKRWADHAARLAAAVVEPGRHLAIVTCGPPHMVHASGGRLAQRVGIPHVMDLRDPWSLVQRLPEHFASPLWWRVAARREATAVHRAALVITNTPALKTAMQRLYPAAAACMLCVLNGYDDEPLPPSRRSERFTIAYAGAIYLDRDPRPLFQAAAQVVRRLGLGPDTFGIEFMGEAEAYGSASVAAMAAAEGLDGMVRVLPRRSRREALEFLAGAAMLVSLPQDSDLAIPSKIFEYARFDAWILALVSRDSATGLLLQDTSADIVAPDDVAGMARVIEDRWKAHARGDRPRAIAVNEALSRRSQAGLMLDAIAGLNPVRSSTSPPTS